jgi:DNA-binding NarL/FixJ family response regulator
MNRVLILADHVYVVNSIRLTLRQATGFQVVGIVDGRTCARAHLIEHKPDVILVDEMHNRSDALARLGEIAAELPDSKRLLLTNSTEDEWLEDAFAAGADAVISKTVHPVAMGTLLREISQGHVIQRFQTRRAPTALQSCPLTSRELEILRLAAQGHTNGRIARELWVTEQTVKFHLSNTYRKLGVANRTEASRYAFQHQLMDRDLHAVERHSAAVARPAA